MRFFGAFVLAWGCAVMAACGGGTEVSATFSPANGGAPPSSTGQGGAGGEESTTASTTASVSSSATTAASTSAGAGGAGGDTSTGSGPVCDYSSPNKCAGAAPIMAVDGDQNMDQTVVKGTTAKWFLVQVNEAVSSVVGHDLSFTATLESPAGMDFDLWVYPGNGTMPDCNVAPKHAVGTPESWGASWSDSLGSDDTRVYTLEVRYASGMICPAEEWTLTVKGHT